MPEREYAVSYGGRKEEGVFGISHCDGEQALLNCEYEVAASSWLLVTEVYVNGTAESRGSMRVDQLSLLPGPRFLLLWAHSPLLQGWSSAEAV